jgi:serine/threonine-protein kinase RsbW
MFNSSTSLEISTPVDTNTDCSGSAGEAKSDHVYTPDRVLERAGVRKGETWGIQPLVVAGCLESLSDIAAYVLNAAKEAGLDTKGTYGLRLAVDEIATNIIVHGYEEAGIEGSITVRAYLAKQILLITLEDTARPYNPRMHPEPAHLHLSLDDREVGGLGIYLALKYVDEFIYAYINKKNCNMFVMYRTTTHLGKAGASEDLPDQTPPTRL